MAKSISENIKWLWNLFASMKLAVILLLIITSLSLFGTFFAPVAFFHTGWFLVPGFLLMLNILVCSFNRWQRIKTLLQGGKVRQPEAFWSSTEGNSMMTDLPCMTASLAAMTSDVLKKRGYRVRSESCSEIVYLAADKNRYFKLGTYVSHLSLVLFVLAFLIGSAFGFRDTGFIVAEQETRFVGHDTGLSLNLLSFTDAYYEDQTPMDYRSEVVLYKNGQLVKQAVIRVNHPLNYEGTRFYQSFFGPAVRIKFRQASQDDLTISVALPAVSASQGYQRPVGSLVLESAGLSFRFIGSAVNATDKIVPKDQLAVEIWQKNTQTGIHILEKGKPAKASGIEITYLEDIQFSGFQVSRDPGNTLIWIASSLFVLGMIAVLFFVHLQLWIQIKPLPTGKSRIYLRLAAPRGFSQAEEMTRTLEAIKRTVESHP
ncbi:MAG: cytochrome c biogenesis protein ResB [Clostridiaceae bacterium]|jgi:cytochrome c biogenesis protein|nr:cytochrome c biogenesis protein ResB [Clostridiaceae bacterium]